MKKLLLICVGLTILAAGVAAQNYYIPRSGELAAPTAEMEKPSGWSGQLDWPIVGTIQTSVPSPTGLAYDGQYFYVPNWSAGSPEIFIYKIDPSTGATQGTIPSPSLWPGGITWDGSHFWVVDYDAGMKIFKIDPTGTIIAWYTIDYSAQTAGVAWDGQYVYYGNNSTDLIYKMDPSTGITLETITVPTGYIAGLTYYDGHLWYSERDTDILYKITMAGVIVDSSPAVPGSPAGLTFVDGNLWNVESQSAVITEYQISAPQVSVTLTPVGLPIQIPAAGGSFDYNIEVTNSGGSSVTFDVWCDVTLPSGAVYGPTLGPVNATFAAGFTADRDRTQAVPAGAPPGNYTYHGYVGLYPGTVWDTDSFPFEKLTTGDGAWVGDWNNAGEAFEEWITEQAKASVPDAYSLLQNYPNPFNPETNIQFAMPEADIVSLKVYNTGGQLVTTLVDGYRCAGWYEVTWDATNLATGLYIYRLDVGERSFSQKAILVK
jgi:glutamine cyclotransferase